MKLFFLLVVIVLLFIAASRMIRIVPEAQCYVIEFLGSYKTTWTNGLHFKIPVVERVAKKVSMKEQMEDFPPQPVITKDNVTMKIDTVVFYKIIEPKLFVYGVENPILALSNLTATTLRNIIGAMDLDDTLVSRDEINEKMQVALDMATDPWGIKVSKVELKSITPPTDIQNAMEKQMQAERSKRAKILDAEAHKESAIRRAEGEKAAQILYAEAEKEAEIARAAGRAEATRLEYEAEAKGLALMAQTGISESVIVLKKLEALKALGDGRATKIVVPTELAGAATGLNLVAEMLGTPAQEPIDKTAKSETVIAMEDPCCDEDFPSGSDDLCCD